MAKKNWLARLLPQCVAACRWYAYMFIAFCGVFPIAHAADALRAFNVNPSTVAVYGSSSGGFMAAQAGIAYSSLFPAGFAVVSGGPYDCVRTNQQYWVTCIRNGTGKPDIAAAVANMLAWSGNAIDDVANIAKQRIYIYIGLDDAEVGPGSANQLHAQVLNFAPSSNVRFDQIPGATHSSTNGFDTFGTAMQWIYPDLRSPVNVSTGQLLAFDQTPYSIPGTGMGATGFLYVPLSCAGNARPCRLLVLLHACGGNYDTRGLNGVLGSTYERRIADANDLIILYPQTANDFVRRTDIGGGNWTNSAGCWDYYGLYSSDYDQKSGPQLAAIAAMVRAITAGHRPIPPSDCLFNWAERTYPALFAPPTPTSLTLGPYYLRYYAQTNSHLGTSASDGNVYYLGPGPNDTVQNVGPLSFWLPHSGCQ
jgi:hypothetical protein